MRRPRPRRRPFSLQALGQAWEKRLQIWKQRRWGCFAPQWVRLELEVLEDRTAPSVTPLGSEFLVNTYTPGIQQTFSPVPSAPNPQPPGPPVASQVVAMNPTTSEFVVAWTSQVTGPGHQFDIYARLFHADGTPEGSPFLVGTSTSLDQIAPAVAMDSNGDFVFAWQTFQNGQWNVALQEFSNGGAPNGNTILVSNPSSADQFTPSVAIDSSGHFVVAYAASYQNYWGIVAQAYSPGATFTTGPIVVDSTNTSQEAAPSVSMDSNGNFAVAWEGHDSGHWDIYASLYDATGTLQSGPVTVNTTTAGDQVTPSLAMDQAGNFVVTWASQGQDGSGWGVFAQRYDAAGTAQGQELQVNTYTPGDQANPMVAMSPNGSFLITWSSNNQNGGSNGWDIYQQAYTPSGNTEGSETLVNSYLKDDQQYPAVAMSTQEAVTIWSSNNQDGHGSAQDVYGQVYKLPGVVVTPTSGLQTTKAGGEASFSVVLNSQPNADVTFTFSGSNTNEYRLNTPSVTFTSSSWNVPQVITVTGKPDYTTAGNIPYTIYLSPGQSTDPSYSGLVPAAVSLVNVDMPTPGVTITPLTPQQTTESGGTAEVSIVLNTQPLGFVYIPISTSDSSIAVTNTSGLTFSGLNNSWKTPQIVTLTGQDDEIETGDQTYTLVVGAAQATDSNYSGQFATSIPFVNQETDQAGVTVTPLTSLVTSEGGGSAIVSVQLTSKPTDTVTIPISVQGGVASLSTSSLTFSPNQWNQPQDVTIQGLDDQIVTSPISYDVVFGAAQSNDSYYNNQFVNVLSLVNLETDVAGVTVTPLTPLVTSESGGTAQFSVQLISKPTDTVTIPLSTTNGDASLSTASLIFDSTTWAQAQIVTVTGLSGAGATAGSYQVVVGSAQSNDPYYNGLFATSLSLTNNPLPPPAPPPITPPLSNPSSSGSTATTTSNPIASSSQLTDGGAATGIGGLSGGEGVSSSSLAAEASTAALAIQQVVLESESKSETKSSTGVASTPDLIQASLALTAANPGAVAVAHAGSLVPALSASEDGGGGGGAAAGDGAPANAHPSGTSPSHVSSLDVVPTPASPRDAAAPATALVMPGPGSPGLPNTLPVPVPQRGSFPSEALRTHFDEESRSITAALRSQKLIDAVFASGIVTSVGYVVFSSRGASWLLSAVTARPLWKQLDPLEVLFAWETERKQCDKEDEETLQSLVD